VSRGEAEIEDAALPTKSVGGKALHKLAQNKIHFFRGGVSG